MTQESSIILTGVPREHPKKPGVYELDIRTLEIVSLTEDYPITPKEHGVEFLMDHRHLWLRSRRQHAILRVRHTIIKAVRDFFDDNGFTLCDTPVFTPAACEGTTTLFEVGYFDEKAYLTQSGQLYNEATAAAFGKVYCFGPTFRAEKSKTRRHLTEFWMVEPEVAYAKLDEVMTLAENFISSVVGRVLETRQEELKHLERDTAQLEKAVPPFPRLQYDDAVKMLQQAHAEGKVENRFEWGGDFGAPDETYLSSQYDKPVMVHRYPSAIKSILHGTGTRRGLIWHYAWTCWRRKVTVKSSAAASVCFRTNCCCKESMSINCRPKLLIGIWICANTAAFRTADLAWASNDAWPGSADLSMCAKPFRSRECSIG